MDDNGAQVKNAVIIACSSLSGPVAAAQKKMGTRHPVLFMDRRWHMEPEKMREHLIEALASSAARAETVLVAMGFCGGSWESVRAERRVIIPRVDDCITLLLHTDERPHINLKEKGHFYLRDTDVGRYSVEGLLQRVCEKYGGEKGREIFDSWFASYTHADIIETGTYDSRANPFAEEAERGARLIKCALRRVPGSNLLLEKLVSGRWDGQFVVAEAGETISREKFFAAPPR